MKKIFMFLGGLLLSHNAFAQAERDSILIESEEMQRVLEERNEVEKKKGLTFSGYIETFYSFDFNQPNDHIRQKFFYTFNRHNEININLARIKASYDSERFRANFALMAGTYPEDNMTAEQGMLKYVEEAEIGVRLSKTKDVWLEVGIMPSYIGLEGEISKDNLTLTRTVAVANSPFFMTGAKLSYTHNGKWSFNAGIFNGWQKIRRGVVDSEGNIQGSGATDILAFGTKVVYKPNEAWTFNSSTYFGKDPATETKMRYFHDFYTIYRPSDKWEMDFIFDFGVEQKSQNSREHYIWWSPNLIMKYNFTPKFSTAGRIEYYHDPNNVMGGAPEGKKFQIFGASVNFDYLIHSNVMGRLEFRNLRSKDLIFKHIDEQHPMVKNNFFITMALDAWF